MENILAMIRIYIKDNVGNKWMVIMWVHLLSSQLVKEYMSIRHNLMKKLQSLLHIICITTSYHFGPLNNCLSFIKVDISTCYPWKWWNGHSKSFTNQVFWDPCHVKSVPSRMGNRGFAAMLHLNKVFQLHQYHFSYIN